MANVSTIGNATLIAYEGSKPILATDPWIGDEDEAYFGSWTLSHKIPSRYKQDILDAKFIWFSHGHPDHLNPSSINRFLGKKILLPDHVGSRIAKWLSAKQFDIEILPDREWVQISAEIKVMCITTHIQDSMLLVAVNDKLFVNLNDAGTRNATGFIRGICNTFDQSYLLCLSGYGDADMINCYDAEGKFVVPPAKNNIYVGEHLSWVAKSINVNTVIPFSSHHQYQRTDSVWAQEYVTPLHAYSHGLYSDIELIPPFVDIDCNSGAYQQINPDAIEVEPIEPEKFGDNWSDQLEADDQKALVEYFMEKEVIRKRMGFIKFVVGGQESTVNLNKNSNKGITFTVPRHSLMTAVKYEIFDDLLIGNFMKTTLHNMESLYDCDFNFHLTKYADNGGAKTEEEVRQYLKEYKRRCGRQFIYDSFLDSSANILQRLLFKRNSKIKRSLKSLYYRLK
ncbi:MAG: MBL fold metallo-hydrolase [Gammaproteobacteria bacterium]|nr:MBL fold metallo-hydrolase [Gammaproteobacteria bacterium]